MFHSTDNNKKKIHPQQNHLHVLDYRYTVAVTTTTAMDDLRTRKIKMKIILS